MIKLQILFEDDFLVAIDKPAGIIVNNADSVDEETVEDWVREKLRIKNLELRIKNNESNNFYFRAGIVHRLDRETSGILLIAKNEAFFEKMTALFKERNVKKEYTALVHGQTEKSGLLNFKISRCRGKGKFIVDDELGKDALTQYETIRHLKFNENYLNDFWKTDFERLSRKYDLKRYSLLKIKLHTGRTHQIRVHFSHIKHPVAGDELYGIRKTQKFERFWCPRHFLHAGKIEFIHPATHCEINLVLDLPKDLKTVLNKCF